MTNAAYDIFKRDGFGALQFVEPATNLGAANRRIIELAAGSPGKYMVVNRASGQMVGGGTMITSERSDEPPAREQEQEVATSSRQRLKDSDGKAETLWR